MNKSHHKGSQRLISLLQDSGCYIKNGVYASKWLHSKKENKLSAPPNFLISPNYAYCPFFKCLFLKYLWLVKFSMYFLTKSPGFQNLVRCYRDVVKKKC